MRQRNATLHKRSYSDKLLQRSNQATQGSQGPFARSRPPGTTRNGLKTMKRKMIRAAPANGPPEQYQAAMADIEERAARGELTIAEVKREIFALRDRFAVSPDMVMRWAAQAQAESSSPAEKPVPARGTESSGSQGRAQSNIEDDELKPSRLIA